MGSAGMRSLSTEKYVMMIKNLPSGFNEFVVHPGYVDGDLQRWSTYLGQRELELGLLLNEEFRRELLSSDVHLMGYGDLPVNR